MEKALKCIYYTGCSATNRESHGRVNRKRKGTQVDTRFSLLIAQVIYTEFKNLSIKDTPYQEPRHVLFQAESSPFISGVWLLNEGRGE